MSFKYNVSVYDDQCKCVAGYFNPTTLDQPLQYIVSDIITEKTFAHLLSTAVELYSTKDKDCKIHFKSTLDLTEDGHDCLQYDDEFYAYEVSAYDLFEHIRYDEIESMFNELENTVYREKAFNCTAKRQKEFEELHKKEKIENMVREIKAELKNTNGQIERFCRININHDYKTRVLATCAKRIHELTIKKAECKRFLKQ